MENTVLTTEIKRNTELLRQSAPDKKGELEKKLVELYFEFYRTSTELTTKGDIVNRLSQVKVEKPTNWSLKVKALEELQYRRYDVVVTLLDGKKLPKEQVPAGAFYINEKGQKCQKALKVTTTKPNPKDNEKPLANLSQKLDNGFVKVRDGVIATATIGASTLVKLQESFGESPQEVHTHTTSSLSGKLANAFDTVSDVAENTVDAISDHSDTIKRVFQIIGMVLWIILKIAFKLFVAVCLISLELMLILYLCPFAIFFGFARNGIRKIASWIGSQIRWIFGRSSSGEDLHFSSGEDLHFRKDGGLDMRFNSSKSFLNDFLND